ncbi:MAG TPA: nuclear transport factor 2 family protein [Solirubrobacteraceae bacterium]|nr:nuclear transport factor 2 family protein [Solirubrobacteraceae bacterium]
MSAANETLVDQEALLALKDRTDIQEVLYRYSSCVDSFDTAGVRSCLADDIWAQYGNGEPVTDGDTLANWIADATATVIWQHHLLNVYHVTIDGDHASTVSYLTSYQVFEEDPNAAIILVARYHDELRRTPDGWKISKRVMELLWGESKADEGYLASLGGRGPKIWARS